MTSIRRINLNTKMEDFPHSVSWADTPDAEDWEEALFMRAEQARDYADLKAGI